MALLCHLVVICICLLVPVWLLLFRILWCVFVEGLFSSIALVVPFHWLSRLCCFLALTSTRPLCLSLVFLLTVFLVLLVVRRFSSSMLPHSGSIVVIALLLSVLSLILGSLCG